MSRHYVCDFCGLEASYYKEDVVKVSATMRNCDWDADYHPRCWERILEVIRMAQEFEGHLASFPVASQQSITAKRRKLKKPNEDD